MKNIALAVCFGLLVALVGCGGAAGGDNNAPKAGSGGGGGGAAADAFALYKKDGRTWTIRQEAGGMVMLMKSKVSKVTKDGATVTTTTTKEDGTDMGMPPQEMPITFTAATGGTGGEMPKNMPEVKEESVTVKAGTFNCIKMEMAGTTTWSSKEFPGLTVKMEGNGAKSELIEFSK
ncbi:MAG: hypothetical protein AB7K09_06695 [Planctomycetota bacterium]